MSSSESSELLRAGTSRRDVIISWLLIVAGLFLNVTLHFGDSGRVLLLTVFDVVLLLLLAHQVFRYGLQWSAWMVWPLITIFVLIAAAGVAFYLGDNIRIAGLLRETIKYLGFFVGVTICGLLYRSGSLAPLSAKMIALLGALSLLYGGFRLRISFRRTTRFLPSIVTVMPA